MISDLDIAYFAGIVDGEGSIGIYKSPQKNSINGFEYKIRLTIANTNKDLLLWIQDKFFKDSKGNGCLTNSKYINKPKWKEAHFITTSNRKAINIIKIIEPYIKVKKQQAKLAIKLYELTFDSPTTKDNKIEKYKIREEIYNNFREINKRGL